MFLDLKPFMKYRDYRLLYIGQAVSFLGSMITYVALPYQMYELTQSSLAVGLVGIAELLPLPIFAIWGGALADKLNRRRMLIYSELLMTGGSLALAYNAMQAAPSVWPLYAIAAFMGALNGFHRPALEALTPQLVQREDFAAIAAHASLRISVGAIIGPAMGGLIIARSGLPVAYFIDAATFAICVVAVYFMHALRTKEGSETGDASATASIKEGLQYAASRQEILGTYIVDIAAMTFAMPMALFPALAQGYGGATAAGWLYSSMAIGGIVVTVMSGWMKGVRRRGRAVIIAAGLWGVAIIGLGFAANLTTAVACLIAAGMADTVSGMFRSTIWNETIPTLLRGRLAGLQMLSFLTGPLLGNARAGWVAQITSLRISLLSGGILCVFAVFICAIALPQFWHYEPEAQHNE